MYCISQRARPPKPMRPTLIRSFAPGRPAWPKTWDGTNIGAAPAAAALRKLRLFTLYLLPDFPGRERFNYNSKASTVIYGVALSCRTEHRSEILSRLGAAARRSR